MNSPQLSPQSAADIQKENPIKVDGCAAACCAGVDQPGLGYEHAGDCPVSPREITEFRNAQPVPQPLRSFVSDPACKMKPGVFGVAIRELLEDVDDVIAARQAWRDHREGLFAKLLFRARNLAQQNIGIIAADGKLLVEELQTSLPHCLECSMTEHLGKLKHLPTCETGATLDLIDEILNTNDSKEREAEGPGAGAMDCTDDGIRLCGLKERVCMLCGKRDGEWDAEWRAAGHFPLESLKLNQCVSVGIELKGHTLFTHRCLGERGQGSEYRGLGPGSRDSEKAAQLTVAPENPEHRRIETTAFPVEGGAQ